MISHPRTTVFTLLMLPLCAAACGLADHDDAPPGSRVSSSLTNAPTDLSTANDAIVKVAGCTGTLVGSRYVLTVGHCISKLPPSPTSVSGDWQTYGVWYENFPNPNPTRTPGLTSGRKGVPGIAITIEVDTDRPGFDYRSFSTASAAGCRNACASDSRCQAYTHVPDWVACFLKEPGFPVYFGGDSAAPRYTARAMRHNLPVNDDIIMLELDAAVPASIATPIPVLTDIPDDEPLWYLANQQFEMHGFGDPEDPATATQRHQKAATLADFPFPAFGEENPVMLLATGAGCTEVRPGDSGGPLLGFVHGQRTVVAVAQGTQGCGGRYVVPFSKGGSTALGARKNDIARWVELTTMNSSGNNVGALLLGDFNGDRRKDYVCHDQVEGDSLFNYAGAAGTFDAGRWARPSLWCNRGGDVLYTGDFNGDRRDDLLCHNKVLGDRIVLLADASGHFGSTFLRNTDAGFCTGPAQTLYVGDFNGDHRDDVLCHSKATGIVVIAYSPIGGAPTGSVWTSASGWCFDPLLGLHVGDFNGDGRDDLLCHGKSTGSRAIDFADGSGQFASAADWQDPGAFCSHARSQLHVGDFNGDGRDDLLCHTKSSGWRDLDFADAAGRFFGNDLQNTNAWCIHAGAEVRVGDFNGDGRDDLLCHTRTNGTRDLDFAAADGLAGNDLQDPTAYCRAKPPL